MPYIKGRTRLKDMRGENRLYFVLIFGILATVLIFALSYQNIILALTLGVLTIAIYILLAIPPRDIKIQINEAGITIDTQLFDWNECVGWSIVDLGETVEFVIQTSNLLNSFEYFYLPETTPGIELFIQDLAQFLPYNEDIPTRNIAHNLLRRLKLK